MRLDQVRRNEGHDPGADGERLGNQRDPTLPARCQGPARGGLARPVGKSEGGDRQPRIAGKHDKAIGRHQQHRRAGEPRILRQEVLDIAQVEAPQQVPGARPHRVIDAGAAVLVAAHDRGEVRRGSPGAQIVGELARGKGETGKDLGAWHPLVEVRHAQVRVKAVDIGEGIDQLYHPRRPFGLGQRREGGEGIPRGVQVVLQEQTDPHRIGHPQLQVLAIDLGEGETHREYQHHRRQGEG